MSNKNRPVSRAILLILLGGTYLRIAEKHSLQ